jgi:hypothetical protein
VLVVALVLVLVLLCVLVFPRLLHPPLSAAELEAVTSVDKRIELQQAQAKLENDARATLLQGVAGLLLVAGAIATWRQVQVSREGQLTERFATAIDHLGSDKAEVRLGGIYTLERIAKNSSADRQTVQSVLAASVRTHAPWLVGAPNGPQHPTLKVDPSLPWLWHRAPDVQTAMWVLGRRPPARDELPLYLARVDLRGAFLHDARLSDAELRHTNLARAQMRQVHLEHCDLTDADLRRANMRDAHLTGADLEGAHLQRADLRGADLREADLKDANLNQADLRGATLHRARLENTDLADVWHDAATVWPDGFQPPRPHRGADGAAGPGRP